MFFEGIHHVNMFFGTKEDRPPLRFACRVRRANASSRSQSQEGVAALGSQGWHSPEARESSREGGKGGVPGAEAGGGTHCRAVGLGARSHSVTHSFSTLCSPNPGRCIRVSIGLLVVASYQ